MRTPALTLAAASLVVLALPAEAQWNVERRSGNAIAVATGIDGQIEVGVSCQGNNQVVVLTLPGATFRNGDVEVQWDNGSTEQYALQNQNATLSGSSESPQVRTLIAKLRQRNTARLRVTKAQNEQVTDRIRLTGSSRAIGSLPCSSAARDSAPGAADGAPASNVTAAPSGSPASGNLTAAQRNAVRSANSYLQLSGFSRQGLIDQLSSEFGDRYSVGDATVAVDSLSTDWNAQAARSTVTYLELSGFSCQGLIDQLSSEFGEKYTVEQATYGVTQAGIC